MNSYDQDVFRRREMADDSHRPIYHFLPPGNWMNDPNGVIQWSGKTHLFYQYHPHSAGFGSIHWGHAVSEDLIHWHDLPIALAPTPGGPDERGCWSGCAVNNNGTPTLVYTGVRGERYEFQTQCLAVGDDQLLTWQKYSGNPVLSQIPAVSGQDYDFRDPFVWRDGESWYLILASRIMGIGGSVFLYRSPDLIRWEFLHPLLTGSIEETGSVWECPSFFPLGDKWVLVVAGKGGSIPFTVFYFVGDYVNQRFTPLAEGVLDYGYFYAPYTMQDAKGRRLMWGWLREGRSEKAHLAAGWAGAHAIPRELSLHGHELRIEPVPELAIIHGPKSEFADLPLSEADRDLEVEGLALDIAAEIEVSGTVGLAVACTQDGSEQTRIVYDPDAKRLIVQREQSSLGADHETFANEAPHVLTPGETLKLRILVDGSVLEIIANSRTSISSRIYPSRPDSRGLRIFGQGVVKSMTIWHMQSIWPK